MTVIDEDEKGAILTAMQLQVTAFTNGSLSPSCKHVLFI